MDLPTPMQRQAAWYEAQAAEHGACAVSTIREFADWPAAMGDDDEDAAVAWAREAWHYAQRARAIQLLEHIFGED